MLSLPEMLKKLPWCGRLQRPSYASIIWIRFMGLPRSRAALSAFAIGTRRRPVGSPVIERNLGRRTAPVK